MEGRAEGKWGRGEEDGGGMRRNQANTCARFEPTVGRDSVYSSSHLSQVFLHLHTCGVPSRCIHCHSAHFVVLALKTDSSFS